MSNNGGIIKDSLLPPPSRTSKLLEGRKANNANLLKHTSSAPSLHAIISASKVLTFTFIAIGKEKVVSLILMGGGAERLGTVLHGTEPCRLVTHTNKSLNFKMF